MGRIKQLSVNLINQIAAGEVIDRPAGVVKELVENSIDAGATKIEISISNECRNIRVADNGCGIYPDDIQLAFTKHATSKLNSEQDLFNIQTLGFRGEALASIISVARVCCTTKTKDCDFGTKVTCENSVVKSQKIGCADGTIMEVNDLFFNQPARLKFLKNPKTEFAYIQELIQALALSHTEIAFILKNDGAAVISTTVNSDLMMRITHLYSSSLINELKKIEKVDAFSAMKLTGYASIPSYTRSSKKSIFTFVNSRMVKCPILIKAIDVAYKNMLPSGRYPFVVINLQISPNDIDVNVHPTKREIRYKSPNQVFSFVQSAIDFALLNSNTNPEPQKQSDINENKQSNKIISFPKTLPQFGTGDNQEENDDVFIEFPAERKIEDVENDFSEETEQKKIDINFEIPSKLKQINVIGQYNNTYILVENDDNLEIIDQHIAQERYIYEKLKKEKKIASQLLIISDVLDVSPEEIEILDNASNHLEKFGYKIEKISDTQIIFKKIPQILSKVKPKDILSELIKNLKDSPENNPDTIEEKILITISCKASVKAGEKLTLWQMEEIVKKLRASKNPYTCPHGRPISHYIPLKEVASFFDRNVK